ncbi:hypothetical protein FE257_003089 [Aspergillus nanangensis]|uniref:Uncharacterized protein n=1 Tax=Aspergillus nanangensis TaxID=2582783 RepID=A0AAD4CBZ7_ASPNN|nr:hypothetical protein FE257_003089 [Aspergillus nanangensis]
MAAFAIEQAVYWSSWKAERELRTEIQAPDFTPAEEELALYPPFFPSPPLFHQSSVHVDIQQRADRSWYFFLSEISIRRLTFSVVKDRLIAERLGGDNYLHILAMKSFQHQAQAEEWVATLPEIVSISSTPAPDDDICRFILRGKLMDFYELVYWPFVEGALNAQPNIAIDGQDSSVKTLQDLTLSGLQHHVTRIHVNKPGFRHRHHGTPRLIQSCTRSALVLIGAKLEMRNLHNDRLHLLTQMPIGWEDAVLAVVELNEYWAAEFPESFEFLSILRKSWERLPCLEGGQLSTEAQN